MTKLSDYGQKNVTITGRRPTHGTARKRYNHSHTAARTESKATSSLFLGKMIAQLERTLLVKTRNQHNPPPPTQAYIHQRRGQQQTMNKKTAAVYSNYGTQAKNSPAPGGTHICLCNDLKTFF